VVERAQLIELMSRTIDSTETAARRFLEAAERGAANGVPENMRFARQLHIRALASAARARDSLGRRDEPPH
jgi:hypothetical protein